jgi:TonB family protein
MKPRELSLTTAVTDGDTEAVQALIAAGTDPNAASSGGQTPLILAIIFRRIKILNLLLEAGADPQLRDSLGLNATDWAQRRGFTEGVKLLAQTPAAQQNATRSASRAEPETAHASVPTQIKEQNSPGPKESEHFARSDEGSLLWIAGLKRRIDEETTNKVKEVHGSPTTKTEETESRPQTAQPHVVVDDGALPVQLPAQESMAFPDPLKDDTPETSHLKNESYSETITPVVPRNVVGKAPSTSRIRTPSMSSSLKRCPKCNTIYNSELLSYCAIDMAPLVDANKRVVASRPEEAVVPRVWLLVVLIFVVAAGITYFMLPNFRSKQEANPGLFPTQAFDAGNSPSVDGELRGKQVNVPEPQYPVAAKRAHVSGTVTVQVSVNKSGTVIATKVIEGDRQLRSAAVAAAQKATFSPEKLMGRGAVGTIAYTFKE